MARNLKCHICANDEANQLTLEMIGKGFGDKKICYVLGQNGFHFTPAQVSNHILKHVEIIKTEVSIGTPVGKEEKSKRIEKDCEAIQISIPPIPENCTFRELVEWVQRGTARIYLKQMAIVEACQDMYLRGEIRHPTEQIRGLRDLSGVLDLVFAYKTGTDLTRAIQVIEAEGYDIVDNSQGPKQLPGNPVEPGK